MITPTPNTVRSSAGQALLEPVLWLVGVADRVLDGLHPALACGHGVLLVGQRSVPAASHGCRAGACLRCTPWCAAGSNGGGARMSASDRSAPPEVAPLPIPPPAAGEPPACVPVRPARRRQAPPRARGGRRRRLRGLRRRAPPGAGRRRRTRCGSPPSSGGFVWLGLYEPTRGGARRDRGALRPAPARRRGRRLRPPAPQARALRRRAVHGAEDRDLRGARGADRDQRGGGHRRGHGLPRRATT